MAQLRWIYASPSLKQYVIGLYHGDRSNHVLIYINNRISVIDFHIRKDKTYSFFIEEDICELSLKKEIDQWTYALEINTTIQTPANIARKKRENRFLFYSIGFLLAFFAIVWLLIAMLL